MERYGHEQIGRGSRQRPQAELGQQLGEGGRQGAAAAELEGVKRLPRDGSIAHRGPRIRKWPPSRPALAAEPLDGQRDAAAAAPWRREALETLPACPAQRIATTRPERRLTHGTEGWEKQVEGGREPWPDGGRLRKGDGALFRAT